MTCTQRAEREEIQIKNFSHSHFFLSVLILVVMQKQQLQEGCCSGCFPESRLDKFYWSLWVMF
uniref:Uncharacterized protein n=1 Tax=Anabas testudineus TaxID=64144 RepID=A0A7N6B2V2_ANATE